MRAFVRENTASRRPNERRGAGLIRDQSSGTRTTRYDDSNGRRASISTAMPIASEVAPFHRRRKSPWCRLKTSLTSLQGVLY